MNTKKIRTILILLLSITNLILLINVSSGYVSEAFRKNEISENISIIFDEKDIVLSENIDFNLPYNFYEYETVRNQTKESSIATIFLGDYFITDNGTGDVRYESSMGHAVFLNDGSLDILFSSVAPHSLSAAKSTAAKIMLDMGFETADYVYTIEEESNGYIANIRKLNNGFHVFNCSLTVILSNEGYTQISGKWYFDSSRIIRANQEEPSIYHVFLTGANRLEDITVINSFEFGQSLTQDSMGNNEVIPTLKYETDLGTFYLDIDGYLLYQTMNNDEFSWE